jgi:hypothetical protein
VATTRIIPIHTGKGRTIAKALKDVTDYMENPLKTEAGEFISSYECDARTADAEFLLAKSQYLSLTGRSQGKKDVIAYQIRQSFPPGEITAEEAGAIGYELAMRFTKGHHAFVIYTHTDRAHIHNHVVWNSTSLDCKRKFRNFFRSGRAVRRLSDTLCVEHGLSIIENPKPGRGKHYGEWLGENKPVSFQDKLRAAIDAALEKQPKDFDEFISLMRESGYTINTRRKHITFLAPDQKKPTRMDTLHGEYTEEAVRERIGSKRIHSSEGKATGLKDTPDRLGLLTDIQSKLKQGKGYGYARWAKVHNLKQMAKTLIYLQDNRIDDYSVLKEKVIAATASYHGLSDKIKAIEEQLAANASLQKQIVTYAKTRQVYTDYRKSGYSKQFRAEHESDILLHQTAKRSFDELGYGKGKKIPTVASLRKEYSVVLDEKRNLYAEYRKAKAEMRLLVTAQSNVDRLLNISGHGLERDIELSGM